MVRKQTPREAGGSDRNRWQRWAGLFLIALAAFLVASLATYSNPRHDVARGSFADGYENAGGILGVWLSALVSIPFGWIAAWIVSLGIAVWGWNRALARPVRPLLWRSLAAAPLMVTLIAVIAALGGTIVWSGSIGRGVWEAVRAGVGPAGGGLLLSLAAFGFLLLEAETLDGRWGTVTARVARLLRGLAVWAALTLIHLPGRVWRWFSDRFLQGGEPLSDGPLGDDRSRAGESGLGSTASAGRSPVESPHPRIVDPLAAGEPPRRETPAVSSRGVPERGPAARPAAAPAASAARHAPEPKGAPSLPPESAPALEPAAAIAASAAAGTSDTRRAAPGGVNGRARIPEEEDAVVVRAVPEGVAGADDHQGAVLAGERRTKRREAAPKALFAAAVGKYVYPKPDLLDEVPDSGPSVPEEELVENSRILTQTLQDFGVSGRVGEVHPGPVITRYEFTPGPGVKVAQILNRQDDLALKLRAIRIRIVAPIPGKAAVGIEVPNHNPRMIYLRRLLETGAFEKASTPLPLALGRDINGFPVVTELSKMPHLLIAGTTGSGKSVCVNSIITSLLMKNGPEDLRLLMVDPKMLELPMYNGIPHLLTDVVIDPKLAARSLKWLLLEMERRYKVLAARGSRNIQSYNDKLAKEGAVHEGEEKLPYIVVLIDELADLMITSGNEVEEPIGRLAQTARAVGIHLIVATQRPSVDVLTGVIKANFPCRIAFQVASRTDSRTILDQNGAEALLGRGDMLYLPPGTGTPQRVHGAYVSEEETQALATFLKQQGLAQADHTLEAALEEADRRHDTDIDDERFEDAARLVVAAGQGSASLLQRRLKVGYARAGRLVDLLESAGIVAPPEGSKPREVLMDDVQLEQMLRERDP